MRVTADMQEMSDGLYMLESSLRPRSNRSRRSHRVWWPGLSQATFPLRHSTFIFHTHSPQRCMIPPPPRCPPRFPLRSRCPATVQSLDRCPRARRLRTLILRSATFVILHKRQAGNSTRSRQASRSATSRHYARHGLQH